MSVARELLVIVAPLRLTLWVLAIATAVILVLIAIGVSLRLTAPPCTGSPTCSRQIQMLACGPPQRPPSGSPAAATRLPRSSPLPPI
ncbi:MAG: hypothetical protein ACXVH3_31135, partial [Solirubrobacteraceae bacterium]